MKWLVSCRVCFSGALALEAAVYLQLEPLSPGTITLHVLSGRLCLVVPVLDNAAIDDKPLVGGREAPTWVWWLWRPGPLTLLCRGRPVARPQGCGGPPVRSLRPGTAPGWGAFPLFLSPSGPRPWQQATAQQPPGLRLHADWRPGPPLEKRPGERGARLGVGAGIWGRNSEPLVPGGGEGTRQEGLGAGSGGTWV